MLNFRFFPILLFAGLTLAVPRKVQACGASAGSGGVAVCSIKDIREKARRKWHMGLTYGYSNTDLKFNGDSLANTATIKQTRQVALAVGEWRATPRWNFQLGAGGLVAGSLKWQDATFSMSPGFVGLLGASFVALRNNGGVPFILMNAQLSSLFASTDPGEKYSAYDLRLGTAVGWNIWKVLTPYALARVFGGPVNWTVGAESITGTDKYHYQVGAGVSATINYQFDLFVEGVPLGEQGVTAGVGVAF